MVVFVVAEFVADFAVADLSEPAFVDPISLFVGKHAVRKFDAVVCS